MLTHLETLLLYSNWDPKWVILVLLIWCKDLIYYLFLTDISRYSCLDGQLRYIASKDISKGEELTFSYLDCNKSCMPTPQRRQILQQEKLFFCLCQRCCDKDYCRTISCLRCKKGLGICSYATKEKKAQAQWICANCEAFITESEVSSEQELNKKVLEIEEVFYSICDEWFK